jgi:hypothetical protein
MRRGIYLFLAIISFSLLGSSHDVNTSRPGVFAYYQVTPNNRCVLVGLLKINGNNFIMRVFDIKSKQESLTMVALGKEEGNNVFMPKSGNRENMMQMILGLNYINFWLHAQENSPKAKAVGSRKRITWPHYQTDHDFKYVGWAPFFGFLDAKSKDGNYDFKLVSMGSVQNENEINNFKLFWRYGRKRYGDKLVIRPGREKTFQFGNRNLILDSHWSTDNSKKLIKLNLDPDNSQKGVPAAWIQHENINVDYDFNELAYRVLISFNCIMVGDSDVNEHQKKIIATRYSGNSMIIKTFVLVKGEPGNYNLTRISVWFDVYNKNKRYFDDLMSKNQL